MTGSLNMNTNKIQNVVNGVLDTDIVNKKYIDDAISNI